MAEQISQDVVKQEQSVDDPSSTDVSATKLTNIPARADLDKISAYSTTEHNSTSSSSTRLILDQDKSGGDLQEATSVLEHDVAIVSPGEITIVSKANFGEVEPFADDTAAVQVTHESTTNDNQDSTEAQDFEPAEDDSVRDTGLDGSISSDAETGKGDTAGKESSDGQEQTRPNALKKSATFKPVSVTKNFLAKSGTATTLATKAGAEKGTGGAGGSTNAALQSAPRPRLVAKSASAHRNSVPKALNMGSKTGRGSGPDPNQVWNRNRVATPQATPKHLTDEEIRQQYGIQLASRPQEEVDGKEAKWADIDDDEDDWAPETIEWNDGTKINLSQIDHSAALAEEQAVAVAAQEKEEVSQPRAPVLKPSTSVGPNATVLKLGSSTQPRTGGLVLKGPSEKPTLVAKPPTSSQVKSPWASLPPVDKVPPVPINTPTQSTPSRFAQRDVHGFDAMPPQPIHAKEIAADDFSRASRETPNGIPKELFNSQSGRYEPVNETRRGSTVRKDQNFRAPSLLQRPPLVEQHGPAEPSAAFQTSRSGQQESAPWSRRRTSSNVSGESGNLGRRISLSKSFDIPRMSGDIHHQRRDSQYEQSPLTPGFHGARHGQRDISPVQSHGQSITSQSPTIATSQPLSITDSAVASPHQGHVIPAGPSIPASAVVENQQDAVVAQRKIMREKREAAIKRKAEEEAREEAEKRERLRVKMEKLGLIDDNKGKKETAEESATYVKLQKDAQDAQSVAPRSPPKPPVPNASGTPQQYGLMKVHASHPVNTVNGPTLTNGIAEKKTPDVTPPKVEVPLPSVTATHGSTSESVLHDDNRFNDNRLNDNNNSHITHEVSSSHPSEQPITEASLSNPRQPSWKSMQQGPNGYSTWNNNVVTTHSASSGNLWGPPANHRALGNGDFQPNLQRSSSRPPPYHSQLPSPPPPPPPPQPIGTPRHLQHSRGTQPQASLKSQEHLVRSFAEESQTVPAFPPTDTSPSFPSTQAQTRQRMPPAVESNEAMGHIKLNTAPAAPNVAQQHPPPSGEAKRTGLSAWTTFGATVAKHDAEKSAQALQEYQARLAEEQRTGIKHEVQLPEFDETWRPVKRGDIAGQRQIASAAKPQHQLQPLNQAQHVLGDVSGDNALRSANFGPVAPQVRSRYQELFEQNQRAVSAPLHMSQSRSPSPPPPETADHPAYAVTSERPLVNLPFLKPKFTGPRPTVKLPPPVTTHQQSSAPEARASTSRSVSQPPVSTTSWKDRIDVLFDRKPSPEKKFADVVDFSSSKVPLELPSISHSAAVTLPPQDDVGTLEAFQMPTKSVEEEDALFEERDFGSVPTVRVPVQAPVHAWTPAAAPQNYRARYMVLSEQHIMSVPVFVPGSDDVPRHNGLAITIRIASMSTPKVKMMARPIAYGSPRSKTGFASKGKPRHAPKSRDSSAAFSSSKPPHNSSTSSPVRNSSSQPARSKGNNTNSMSWARRASGAVQQ